MEHKKMTGFSFFEDYFKRPWAADNWYDLKLSLYGRVKTAIGTEYSSCQ